MSKLLLLSSLVAMIVVPIRAARFASPVKGLKRAIYLTMLFNLAWGAVVLAVFLWKMRDPTVLMPDSVNP